VNNADAASTAGRWGAVLWPSFLGAAALNALVFALLDPQALHGLGTSSPLGLSDRAVYTLGFFFCWAVIAACSALTQWLLKTAQQVNPPLRR
jgi:hypothetical protein